MQRSKKPSKHEQLETWKLPVQRKQILYLHNSYNIWKKGNHIMQFKTIVSPQPKVFSQSDHKSLPNIQTVNVHPPICSLLSYISSKYSQPWTLKADRSPLWTRNITASSYVYMENSALWTLNFKKINHHISWAPFSP